MTESFEHQVRFEQVARNPLQWLKTAYRLRTAARHIQAFIERDLAGLEGHEFADGDAFGEEEFPGVGLFDAYSLLASFALENLLKGIRVSQDPSIVSGGKFKLKTHNLVKLAREAGITLDLLQAWHLLGASEAAQWSAKYPTSLKTEDQRLYTMIQGSNLFVAFEELFDQLEVILAPNGAPKISYLVLGKPWSQQSNAKVDVKASRSR